MAYDHDMSRAVTTRAATHNQDEHDVGQEDGLSSECDDHGQQLFGGEGGVDRGDSCTWTLPPKSHKAERNVCPKKERISLSLSTVTLQCTETTTKNHFAGNGLRDTITMAQYPHV